MGAAKQRQLLEVGAKAPDFRLAKLDGGETSLREELSDGPVLLAFFKISCPVCQLMLPILERIHMGAKDQGPAFLAVSQDDREDTRDFHRRFGVSMPTLLDAESSGYPASNAYGISSVPSLFQVEPDGTISWSLQGFSRRDVQALGDRAGVNPFRLGEQVPEWKSG